MHNFETLVRDCVSAHRDYSVKPSKAFRKFDGATPYSAHPIWCAMTLLTETSLPEDVRVRGYQALLLHDILEDTTAPLPDNLSEDVTRLVQEMTFKSFEEERKLLWGKPIEVKLLKLYDKVSNLLDGSWMTWEKRARYAAHTARLTSHVESVYGLLNIVKIARMILKDLCTYRPLSR